MQKSPMKKYIVPLIMIFSSFMLILFDGLVIKLIIGVLFLVLGLYFMKQGAKENEIVEQLQRSLTKLEESEQRYKSLIENNPAIIFSFDKNGCITNLNKTAEKIIGYQKSELIDKRFRNIIDKEDIDLVKNFLKKVKEGEKQSFMLRILHKDGKKLEIGAKCVPIIVDSQIAGIFLVGKDISEQKRQEEMMLRSEKLSVLGELAAGVAHEIRNPITSLKGFLQLMKSSNGEIKEEYLSLMLSEVERINFIVSEFMVLSKPQQVYFEKKNLERILHDVLHIVNTHAILNDEVITLKVKGTIPLIECEENQLKQVFINVIKNAIEATPKGKEIHVTIELADEQHVNVLVEDEGCGIPENLIPKLGEPFYTTKEKGTGLGLMVCFKIIEENHHGKILIISKQNKGTTIKITLPTEHEQSLIASNKS